MLKNKAIKYQYDALEEKKQSGKLAHVSTIRELTKMIYKMLSESRMWKYDNPGLTEDKPSKLDDE
ncbi:MAG: hypothetical protein QXP36_14720 [Conexivisphaerales archaeon]